MTGLSVALVGADGAGKSTVAAALAASPRLSVAVRYLGDNPEAGGARLPTTRLIWHLRTSRGLGPTHGPPSAAPRPTRTFAARLWSAPRTIGLLLNQMAEELWGWVGVRRAVRRGLVVVLDRNWLHDYWFHDVVGADRSPPQRLHGWWLRRVLPRPDLTVCLDADAEVLHARKPEGRIDDLRSRRQEYLDMAASSRRFVIVDVAQPVDDVVHEVIGHVRAELDERKVRTDP